ncbi:MAG: hypothetical protein CHACPFDD_01490 [Phycisphaerae bacterium]|nr:hypothetical protein [Phycisphaerae bacterium]
MESTRPPPRIIVVPPPARLPFSGRVARVVGSIIALAGAGFVAAFFIPAIGPRVGVQVAAGLTMFTLTLVWVLNNRAHVRRRREFNAASAADLHDPLAPRLEGLWKKQGRHAVEMLRAALSSEPPEPRAIVVCVGTRPPADVPDVFFEPMVVSTTQLLGKRLWLAPVALLVIAVWVASLTYRLPVKINLSGFTYIIMLGLGAGVSWVWNAGIRPRYYRCAPGIVQVLQYSFRKQPPLIRSYPVSAGTLVIVRNMGRSFSVLLARDAQDDALPIYLMHEAASVGMRVWQTLLSTAPIPQLSDAELVG